jgi:hypothetical protein
VDRAAAEGEGEQDRAQETFYLKVVKNIPTGHALQILSNLVE